MNKAELIASIAEKSNLTKKDSEASLNAFMRSVEESLAKG
ncbi:MAG: DNA-binding protein, partial [Tissierellia bacterium]|nr:DNA-binding protein [Tissierellia bacterium]